MTELGVRRVFWEVLATHWIAASGESEACGGVAVLVWKHISTTAPRCVEHIRGLILEVSCESAGGCLDLFVVHNYAMGNHEMRRFAQTPRGAVAAHLQLPHTYRAILMGDMNYGPNTVTCFRWYTSFLSLSLPS